MHRIAARLALALLAFGAVACSGGPDPRERLSAAVQALEESGSAAYEMEMDVHAAGDTVGPAMSLSGREASITGGAWPGSGSRSGGRACRWR